MGWSGGGEIFSKIAETVRDNVKAKKTREKLYREMIPEFEKNDCDTLYECEGIDECLDKVLREFEIIHDEEEFEEDDQ